MKVRLLHPSRDFDAKAPLPWNAGALVQDLAVDVLVGAMARGDDTLGGVARVVMLAMPCADVGEVRYRQEVLRDCLRRPADVRALYALAVQASETRPHPFIGILSNYPGSVLGGAIELLDVFTGHLERLREFASARGPRFASAPFTELFRMADRELGDEYLARVRAHLVALKFRRGVLLSAGLGERNEGTRYVLRRLPGPPPSWLERFVSALKQLVPGQPPAHIVRLAERDEAGARALSAIRDRGTGSVANAVAQAAEHVRGFFRLLRDELAFYVGALNLYEDLRQLGMRTCLPEPRELGDGTRRFSGLYDPALALKLKRPLVTNELDLSRQRAVVVTGANEGGKSTFLRSLGLAQLMLRTGMFVAAESFTAEVRSQLFTHFRREEDAGMRSGKLDEELHRMSEMADALAPGSTVFFNESFAATNEREGSEIAIQVVRALAERGVEVVFVTHLYEFAHRLYTEGRADAAFLRAERTSDGTRTFRIVRGEPLDTSYGRDLYDLVFEPAPPQRERNDDARAAGLGP